jgi:membrane-bound metal-dependent hydrolase YbcI (DUF457 family)
LGAFLIILSNLPDIDILIGLIFSGNGNAFHRGPTHSLIFALIAGFLASCVSRRWSSIPTLKYSICTLIVLSHVVADFFLTSAPVSFFWPLEVNLVGGYRGWADVVNSVLLKSFQDLGIVVVCGLILMLNVLFRRRPMFPPLPFRNTKASEQPGRDS